MADHAAHPPYPADVRGDTSPDLERDNNPVESRGHEHADVRIKAYLWFAFWFIAIGGIIHVIVWFFFVAYLKHDARKDPDLHPLSARMEPPPEPRIQPMERYHDRLPAEDLKIWRDAELAKLNSSGPSDYHPNASRIPIDRAMDLLLQQGLPTATQPSRRGGAQ